MRLLELAPDGQLSLTKDLIGNVPPYAILSHTWGADGEEVTFQEVVNASEQTKSKAGYRKILFCGEQAARDNLQYFWVDTCCIDKSNNTELSEAINSMFRWYRNAAKCYVYLPDVSVDHGVKEDSRRTWEVSFRRSRWFTRGWTLQELIAPRSVEFFSVDGTPLGNKTSLERLVHDITGIAIQALQDFALGDFTVDERMTWANTRRTTREEDKAYSLLGIFDICMPLIYGEGEQNALRRLRGEISAHEGELDLPFAVEAPFNAYQRQHEPVCLENTRSDLLSKIYDWIDRPDEASIFWLNGFAGTGKSTIARTVARKYDKERRLGASFFFVKGGGDVGGASKLFATIATQLARRVPNLRPHICDAVVKHKDICNQSLRDQWARLVLEPLSKLKTDGHEGQSFYVLVIDALDECSEENNLRIIPQLLAEARSLKNMRLRIFLTSRPEVPIRHGFLQILGTEHQDFILHSISPPIIDQDIRIFLKHDLRLIAQERSLGPDWPSDEAIGLLVQRASGLFIWAATACRFIRQGRRFAPKRLETIVSSSGSSSTAPEKHLNQIYITVLKQSVSDEYTDEEKEDLCRMLREILGSIVLLFSPLSVQSLSILLSISDEDIFQSLGDLHSVLDIPKDDTQPLRIHHPSFRDFLLNQDRCTDPDFWVNEKESHETLMDHCIRLMSSSLKQDICAVRKPGTLITEVKASRIQLSIPPELQYACLHWTQHLQRSDKRLYDNDQVHKFLQEHLLYWFEALAWMGKLSEGVLISSLESLTNLHLGCRTIPSLQSDGYQGSSAPDLLFAPSTSTVRKHFEYHIPGWIQKLPKVLPGWNSLVQTLEGHSDDVTRVGFSEDGLLLSASDHTAKIWDPNSGALLNTLKGLWTCRSLSLFDGLLTWADYEGTVQLWDARSGALHKTLELGGPQKKAIVAISKGFLASASDNSPITIWNSSSGACLHTLEGHSSHINRLSFSSVATLASQCTYTTNLWNASSGELLETFGHDDHKYSELALSPNGKSLAWTISQYRYHAIKLWNSSGTAPRTIHAQNKPINVIAFSRDNQLLASASGDSTIKLWDTNSGVLKISLYDESIRLIRDLAFSPNSKILAAGTENNTVQLWNPNFDAERIQTPPQRSGGILSNAFSPDGTFFASASKNGTIKLWDTMTAVVLRMLEGHSDSVTKVTFSPDGSLLASGSGDKTIKIWLTRTGKLVQTLQSHTTKTELLSFSSDGRLVASGSKNYPVKVWNTTSGLVQQTFAEIGILIALEFLPDSIGQHFRL
ncbi:WD40-repeat-containing domain protein [Hyaloscypha variabilis]